MPAESEKQVDLGTLRVTATRIEELDESRVVVAVDRKDVVRARAAWARRSERPLVQLVLAVVCGIFGAWVIISSLRWFLVGGKRVFTVIMCGLLLPLGAYLAYDALRRGPILLLETTRGRRRLSFGRKIPRDQLLAFVGVVNRELGHPIELDDSLRQ